MDRSRTAITQVEPHKAKVWLIAMACAFTLALAWSIIPASADTSPVTTPVAVASPEATAVATALATLAPSTVTTLAPATVVPAVTAVPATAVTAPKMRTNAIVRTRGTAEAPCVTDSQVSLVGGDWSGGAQSPDCPARLGLTLTNESVTTATSTFRVGDIVKVEIVARANAATGTYGYATYLDFNTADYQLVTSDGHTPVQDGATAGVVTVEATIDGKAVTTRTNAYRTNNTIGEIDLDVGVTLANSENPQVVNPIMIGPDADTILGTFYLRVKSNPSTAAALPEKFRIGLRHSSAGGERNSVITGAGENVGLNIIGKWDSATPNVAQSIVSLILATRSFSVARIGDVLPIDIKLRANTDARHIDTVQGTVSLATSSFIVVTDPGGTTTVTGGDKPISLAGSQLVTGGAASTGTFEIVDGVANVRIDVTGQTRLDLSAGQEKIVGTIYVRPVQKMVDPIDLNLRAPIFETSEHPAVPHDKVGERTPDGSVMFNSRVVVVNAPSGTSHCYGSVKCSSLSIGAVRGTIGVSLEVRSPLANDPQLNSNNGWQAATSTMTPFTAVDGRYLDVKVIVNAGATDNRSADHFTIVLQKDIKQFDTSTTPEFLPAPGITLEGVQDDGNLSGQYNILRLAASALLTTTTEVGRLRYTLNTSRTDNSYDPPNSTIRVVEFSANAQTSLTSLAGPFQNLYAGPIMEADDGEFDQNVRVRSLAPATLQIETRLQGRRASDLGERFIQPMRVELRTHNAGPAIRRLATSTYQWTFAPSDPATGAATTTFSFGTQSAKIASTTNVRLATGTFNQSGIFTPSGDDTPNAINGIEPGTYDVYVKGQSSVGILIENVEFGAGAAREIRGLVLREGDLDTSQGQLDRININDFAQLSGSYGTSTFSAVNPLADMNQSGYIDVLDFSLLASNYGTATSTFIPNIPVTMTVVDGDGVPLGSSLTMPSSASRTFTVKLDSGTNTVQSATVVVSAAGGYGATPFSVCQTALCAPGTPGTHHELSLGQSATGSFEVGTFMIDGNICLNPNTPNGWSDACEGDLVITLADAQGIKPDGSRAMFSAPIQVIGVDVVAPPQHAVAVVLTGPTSMEASATASFAVSLDVGTATINHAVVTISIPSADGYLCKTLDVGGHCPGESATSTYTMNFNQSGTGSAIALGTFIYEAKQATGVKNITAEVSFYATSIDTNELIDGIGANGHPVRFFQGSPPTRPITVEPNVTYSLHTSLNAERTEVYATATFNFGTWEINEGSVEFSFDPAKLELVVPCTDGQGQVISGPSDSNPCTTPASGKISMNLMESGVRVNDTVTATATFKVNQTATGTGILSISAVSLHSSPETEPNLVAEPDAPGANSWDYSITNHAFSPGIFGKSSVRSVSDRSSAVASSQSIRTSSVRTLASTSTVRTRSTSPNANLWVRTSATDIQPGDIVPVTVGVTTGTRSIDGAQVVLRTGPGVQLVDRDGTPVTSANSLDVGTGAALPSLLHRALNLGQGLLELAFGRQVNPSISGVSGEATLGTLFLKVTGPTQGDLLTIERQGSGQFASLVAGDGDDLTGSLIGLSTTDTVNAPVDTVPVSGQPVIGGTPGSNATAPATPTGPARASAPASAAPRASTVSGPRASLPAPSSMSRAISEDTVRGILSISVPGRAPVELRTGLATSVPDAYCPTVRHNTYIRLEDVGIAGATFGVEPGGVLSWVSPDQAGCVNWSAISEGGLTFTKETIMQFQLARAVPGALLWVLDGSRNGELYEVDASGTATYISGDTFTANQDHFRQVWANVIPVSTSQVDGLASRGAVSR